MNSILITIKAGVQEQEILVSELSEYGAEGFEQIEGKLLVYFNDDVYRTSDLTEILKTCDFEIELLSEQNWNAVWESNFEPVVVGNFCYVRAHFHNSIPGVEHEIIITPKMSFGTGHHATTYMMMLQMSKLNFHNQKVFDFGTGTGILSLLAEKMGASEITAIDADEWSIENAIENLEKNHCFKISVYLSSKIPEDHFDIILANINRNVILENLKELKSALRNKGYLLISGIMQFDEEELIKTCLGEGFSFYEKIEQDNWICVLFQILH